MTECTWVLGVEQEGARVVGVEVLAGHPGPGEEGALAVLGQVADVPLEELPEVPLQDVGVGDEAGAPFSAA